MRFTYPIKIVFGINLQIINLKSGLIKINNRLDQKKMESIYIIRGTFKHRVYVFRSLDITDLHVDLLW